MAKVRKSKRNFGSNYSLSKTEWIQLKHEWRLKLKKSGFKDIEKWSNNDYRFDTFFINSTYRKESYKPGVEEYLRAISTVLYHSDLIEPQYREFVSKLAQGISFREIIDTAKDKDLAKKFENYFWNSKLKKKIVETAYQIDLQYLEEDKNDRYQGKDTTNLD